MSDETLPRLQLDHIAMLRCVEELGDCVTQLARYMLQSQGRPLEEFRAKRRVVGLCLDKAEALLEGRDWKPEVAPQHQNNLEK